VEQVSKEGNSVLVGRGSQQFLKDHQDALRVFLYAPREDKVRRLIARGKTQVEAEQLVDTVDRERKDFIHKYFGAEWPDRGVYHTMINTTIGNGAVVNMILDFVKVVNASLAA
jgi:cytidylate kinase